MQGNANLQLSVNEFSKVVQNRRDLYEALIRNGFYLPKYKTTMITEDYMRNVMHGKAYCPKYAEIKMMPCPRPPTLDVFLKKFHKICRDQNLVLTGVDDSHMPDKRWLLDFIGTLTPQDEIFKKNYLPPVKETKLSELKTISIPANFFNDLP